MRPQLFAADHPTCSREMISSDSCFNEAAAIRCGSRGNLPPRIIPTHGFNEAAAIRCGSRPFVCWQPDKPMWCFNEAAAIRCGSPKSMRSSKSSSSGFNEAAAIRCGSLALTGGGGYHYLLLQ